MHIHIYTCDVFFELGVAFVIFRVGHTNFAQYVEIIQLLSKLE